MENLTNDEFEKRRLTELAKRKALMESIFDETAKLTDKQLEERNKAKEAQKILLQSGYETSVKEWNDFVIESKRDYSPHFGYEKPFYVNVYRLNNWPEQNARKFVKDRSVAGWTNRLVYGRFPPNVLPYLKMKNQILFAYIRRGKYFQFLNDDGLKKLDEIIDDMTMMMIGYDDWNTFEKDYCAKYGLPYQERIF